MFYLPVFSSSIICSVGVYFDSLVVLPLLELLLYFVEYFSVFLSLMSILKYFHKTKWEDQGQDQEHNVEIKLPDPDGDLNKMVPSKAIRAPDESNEQLVEPKPSFDSSTVVCCWEEGGITATIRQYTKCFLYLALKETTVRRIKNVYLSELKNGSFEASHSSKSGDSEVVQQLPPKKKGHPLLYGEELERQVCDYLQILRKNEVAVNTAIYSGSLWRWDC